MQQTIETINALISNLKSLPKIRVEDKKKLERKFLLEFNFNSNHIEGNTLTYGETMLLLLFEKTEGVHEIREFDEMRAHNVAYKLIQTMANESEQPLTEAFIKELNKIILVQPFWKEAITPNGEPTRRLIKVGDYKEFPNSVMLQNGELFEYASPIDTPIKMGELIEWYNAELQKQELHPVVLAALLHYKFVLIHPFDDGNGRISRLLMNYVLFKNKLPPIVIKSIDKKKYLNALNQADTGNIEAFVQYIAEQFIWSIELQTKATKGENIEEDDDLDKEIQLLKKEISTKENLTEKVSNQIVCNLIEHSIFPLFQKLELKLNEFKDFFLDYDKEIIYKRGNVSYKLGFKETVYETMVANWLQDEITNSEHYISNIRYFYHLKGFKKSIDTPSNYLRFNINFNEFHYIVKTTSEFKFPYGKQISEEKQNEIIKSLIKPVMETIKQFNNLS